MTMFKIIISVAFIKTYIESGQCNFLEAESNYQKPKLERNNIVNKGVWVRNKLQETLYDKARQGDFIFRENSLDVDNLLQNNFDAFGENYMQDSPFVSAYVERQKRSSRYLRHKRPRKSISSKNTKNLEFENSNLAKSKIINDLRPTSVFNDYPYEVAILLNSNRIFRDKPRNSSIEEEDTTISNNISNESTATTIIDAEIKNVSNDTAKNFTSPKRSMKYDFESEIIKKIEFTEDINKTNENSISNNNNIDNKINDRNVFDKDNSEWHQTAPIPDVNVYKVVPKEPMQKSKPVTERGLIKVITMLTKTFKKIMRQHNEIKDIHARISDINDEFTKKSTQVTSKFHDFDLKYLYLVKFHEKLKDFDLKMASKEEYFKNKEKDMAKNIKEFENQQKKFLQQQKQFFNIQKLMLSQNEKINLKQNLIAKTQSEISHRQNNFARILKKAKQLYIDSRNPAITKLSSSISKIKDTHKPVEPKAPQTTTASPEPTTESVKINLFSIPTSNKIQQDPDELILKDKDDQAIDDLVYKYYFNNTFIDSFMKNKILNSFMGNAENSGTARTVKNKRNELETTILLPVMEANESEMYGVERERRWINHHSRHKNKRKDFVKTHLAHIVNATDEKRYKGIPIEPIVQTKNKPVDNKIKETNNKNDPFLTMATSFCNEIHQNVNQQMLRWCVEKALRRLQILESKMVPPSQAQPITSTIMPKIPVEISQKPQLGMHIMNLVPLVHEMTQTDEQPKTQAVITEPSTTVHASETTAKLPNELTSPTLVTTDEITYTNLPAQSESPGDMLNFPDNDELEYNLRQFDITPDTEGNVYYEGSIHASDLLPDSESQGVEDIMPGLESNSRLDVDPMTFDLQAKRRALVRKMNEHIRKSLG